jgi:hypothetical protein
LRDTTKPARVDTTFFEPFKLHREQPYPLISLTGLNWAITIAIVVTEMVLIALWIDGGSLADRAVETAVTGKPITNNKAISITDRCFMPKSVSFLPPSLHRCGAGGLRREDPPW